MNIGASGFFTIVLLWLLCGCPPFGWSKRWDRSKDAVPVPPEWPEYEDDQLNAFGTAAFYGGPMDGEYIMLETAPDILRLRRTNDVSGIPVTIAYQLFDSDPDQPEYMFIGEMVE